MTLSAEVRFFGCVDMVWCEMWFLWPASEKNRALVGVLGTVAKIVAP